MIDERTEEAASLYALDLLEGGEKTQFEGLLAGDPSLRKLVDELRASSAAIALLAPPASPPPALRDRVLASISSLPPAAKPAPKATVIPFFSPAWIGWAAAACLAMGLGFLAQMYLGMRVELLRANEAEAMARIESQSALQLLEAERLFSQGQLNELRSAREEVAALQQQADLAQLKITSLVSLLGNSPEARAIAVWNPASQEGVLTVSKLPALAANQDYQLWVIDPQYPNPVDGGVFTVDPATGEARYQFAPNQPVAQATTFAISLERKGGVPVAEGPMVLISL